MSYGDEFERMFDIDISVDQDSNVDFVTIDTDGNGQDDLGIAIDRETGDHAVHAVDETDGSAVTLLYDASGTVISAAFADPSGAITEVSGPDVAGFLTEFGAYTGTDVPLEADDTTRSADPDALNFDSIPDDPDFVSQVPIDPSADTYIGVDDVTSSPGYEDWTEANTDPAVGDTGDADFWFQQSTAYTCGPSAATQIIEDFTGADLGDESTVAEWAADHDLLSTDGMRPEELARTLTHFGVPSTVLAEQTWGDLAGYLDEGRSVVMMVDSGDYWPGNDDDTVENGDTDAVDHIVRIVAIDTERGVAILSDSGTPDGHMLEVPLDTMEEAWNDVTAENTATGEVDRQHLLIVSDSPDPTGEGTTESPLEDFGDPYAHIVDRELDGTGASPLTDFGAPAAAGSASGVGAGGTDDNWLGRAFANPAGWVLVPITLAASRIFATRK